MEAAFYLYTIVVMLVCVASGSVSLSAYFVSRRRSFLFAAAMLLFYFLDLALIFQYEYLGQNVEYSISQFYTIDHPQLKILLALGTLEPMWLILCDFVNERRRTWRLVPALAFIAVSEIVVLCLPVDEFRQWLFYTLRQVFLLWCLAFGVYRYCTARNEVEKARLRRQEPLFFVTSALCLCILIEDVGMILILDASFFANADLLPLYISERNFSENILLLALSFFTLRAVAEKLLRRFGVDIYALKAETLESDLFSEGLTLSLNGKQLLQIGSVAAAIRRRTDVKQDVYYLEMNFEALAKSTKKLKIAAGELSKFPEVRRDLALLVDKSVTFSSLRDAAFAAERKLLKSVSLFDVYEGDKLPEGKKSYALSFILEDKTRTLDERTIERVMANLTRQFEQKCGAQVRA